MQGVRYLRDLRLIGLLAVLPFSAGLAQEPSTAKLGEWIRVYSYLGRFDARFDGLVGDSLVLRRGATSRWYISPLDSIRTVLARRCCATRASGRTRGAIIGGLLGSVVGVGSAVVACDSERYVCDASDARYRRSLVLFVLSRSLLGAVVGALWGHYHPGDAWTPVALPRASAGSTWESAPRIGLSLRVFW